MVQQNMFPQEIRNSNPPQRGAKTPQPIQPASNVKRQATAPQNRSTQVQPPVQQFPRNGNQGAQLDLQQNNAVRLSGRIGRYFEVKQTQTGKSLATFTLATIEPYRDESGNWAKRTVWQRVVTWDKTAQLVSELIAKGARVSVEGKFKTREWTDRENNLRTTTELVARHVHFLDAVAA
jgi:single-strand DNA-binding protein